MKHSDFFTLFSKTITPDDYEMIQNVMIEDCKAILLKYGSTFPDSVHVSNVNFLLKSITIENMSVIWWLRILHPMNYIVKGGRFEPTIDGPDDLGILENTREVMRELMRKYHNIYA